MAVLDSRALHHIERRVLDYKQRPKTMPFGYPLATITDLLDTIQAMRTLKKRYQHRASKSAKLIAEIYSKTARHISDVDDIPDGPLGETEL